MLSESAALNLIAALLGGILGLLIFYGMVTVWWIYKLSQIPEDDPYPKPSMLDHAGPVADVYRKHKRENP